MCFHRYCFRFTASCLAALILASAPLGCLPSETEDDSPDTSTTEDTATPAEFIKPPEPEEQGDAQAATEELIKEWRTLAKNPEANQIGMRDIVIAQELGKRGPENIAPLIDTIDSETAAPDEKVFAMRSLVDQIRPAHLDRLKDIVANSTDGTSRACATSLIAHVKGEDVTEYLADLANDPEERVSLAATVGLAEHGNAEMRMRLAEMYWKEDTNDRERARIVVMLMQNPAKEDFDILSHAMLDPSTDPFTRQNIIYLFGRMGDESMLPALNEAVETYGSDASVQSVARAAIQTIERRAAESAAEETAEAPPSE